MKRIMRQYRATPLLLGLLGVLAAVPAMAEDCDPPPQQSGCVSYYGSVENRYIPCLYTDQNAWDKYVAGGGAVNPKGYYPGQIIMGPWQR